MRGIKVSVYIFLALAAFSVILILYTKDKDKQTKTPEINSFADCVKAGYPVMESYPRQCATPQGKIFVETVVNQCSKDADCGKNFYCNNGQCAVFATRTMCQTDSDCVLVNKDWNFACCYTGRCEAIDYSQDNWIPANKQWFEQRQQEACPSKNQCGPAPMCASRIINDKFTAKCVNNACQKTAK